MSHIFDQAGSLDDSPHRAVDAGDCTEIRERLVECGGNHARAPERGQERPKRGRSGAASNPKRTDRRASRSSRTLSLAVMAKEYIWLWDVRHGVSTSEIAMREGVDVQRVRIGVARAKALENNCPSDIAIHLPRLVPLFPIGPYTPQAACGHNRPIEAGSTFCCMVCHSSGIDDHPGMLRSPLTDPAPEPKPAPAPAAKKPTRETRKQRRKRQFGTPSLTSNA
jgi:hypothetical protein